MEKPYNSLNTYLRNKYGKKVYKLAVDCNFTCPNRDGTKGVGGCIFCSQLGSGDFAADGDSVSQKLSRAKDLIRNKTDDECGYICYFQSFTNTYAPIETLRKLYFEAASFENVVGISIATRPDCLADDVLKLLEELNLTLPVTVELGLQTSNEDTAKFINRCYTNDCFISAVKDLKTINTEVVAHVILGLPGETLNDMLNTVDFACKCGIDGIKLQLLHVLKGTRLAQMEYTPLSMEEYFYILGECLKIIPPDIVIHRLTGDGDKKLLLKPLWSADKHNVLNSLNKYLKSNNIVQGSGL